MKEYKSKYEDDFGIYEDNEYYEEEYADDEYYDEPRENKPTPQTNLRRDRQRKRRRRSRILSIVAILLIILFVALFLCYIMKISGRFDSSNENDINIYTPDMAQTQTATEQPTESITTPQNVPYSNLPLAEDADSNNLLDIIMYGGGNHGVFLTFDDGPTGNITPQVLDILAQYGVKATFFVLGKQVEEYPELAQRAVNEGHLLAGHSYSHDYDSLYATEQSFMDEVNRTYNIISGLYPPEQPPFKLIRFPGGSYNAGDHAAEKQIYKDTLKTNGYYYADWNSLNGDAEGAEKDAEGLFNYFVSSIATNNLVVLMHDAATKQETVNALPRMIEYLQEQGYDFRTLDNIIYNPTINETAY